MKELFEYNKKSNELVIHAMLEAGFAHRQVIEEISHILNTHYMWIAKLKGDRYNKNLWKPISLDDLFKANNLVHEKTDEFIAQDLSQIYTIDLKEEESEVSKTLKDILYEIVLFSNQHRAKIEVLFKKFNIISPVISYINFKKLELIEEF